MPSPPGCPHPAWVLESLLGYGGPGATCRPPPSCPGGGPQHRSSPPLDCAHLNVAVPPVPTGYAGGRCLGKEAVYTGFPPSPTPVVLPPFLPAVLTAFSPASSPFSLCPLPSPSSLFLREAQRAPLLGGLFPTAHAACTLASANMFVPWIEASVFADIAASAWAGGSGMGVAVGSRCLSEAWRP